MTRTQMFPPAPPKVTDLVIRQKTEAMIEYAYVALRQFPQHERHVLSAEIRLRLWTLLHLIVLAHKRYHKRTALQDLDAQIDLLRSQVRLAHSLGYINAQKYETWARHNDEIGRMVGGWLKTLTPQPMGEAQ